MKKILGLSLSLFLFASFAWQSGAKANTFRDLQDQITASLENAEADAAPTDPNPAILEPEGDFLYDQEDLHVAYGQYFETEISLAHRIEGPVNWNALDSELPPGVELEDTTANSILLFGAPKFSGTWCFTLAATSEDESSQNAEELCFHGDEAGVMPTFSRNSLLPKARVGGSYQEHIVVRLAEGQTYTAEVSGNIPPGLNVLHRETQKYFSVKGRLSETGLYRFAIKLTSNDGIEHARQFTISVEEREVNHTCPDGYYYDEDLGYCVQDAPVSCPDGTYYDPDSNSCVQYPAPPPEVVCGPNYHYDPFLDRCVRDSYPRCPIGTRWDSFYNRCVQVAHSCPPGFKYNWFTNRCELRYPNHQCGRGERYDYGRNRCVPIPRGCPAGQRWDHGRCVPVNGPRNCRRDEVWDNGHCVPRSRICRPGEVFDPGRNRCVPRRPRPSCPPGQWYNPRLGRCENGRNPRPMPPRPMPQPPRPMPHPMPMAPRPMPMPPRPMPQPPRPMPHPMPMAPRPMPHPMPMAPRPMPMPPRPMPHPMPMAPRPMPMPPRPMPQPPRPMPHPMPMAPRPMPHPMGMGRRFLVPNQGTLLPGQTFNFWDLSFDSWEKALPLPTEPENRNQ